MNQYEESARQQKAIAIADELWEFYQRTGMAPEAIVGHLRFAPWREIAEAIGVNPPSRATIDQAERLIKVRTADLLAEKADPFEGLLG